ncbi:hypothetical protein GCM10011519_01530 [Marmoricola endophyticus]|uniref:Uncharacterized protein n=1 Tax=Marmoricola endophyticus TaxID=2040280 RepID=A0A917EYC0_9ACTN|nr:hypothetical protein GCM10011519_01530 [Marmoricola endophyticus]
MLSQRWVSHHSPERGLTGPREPRRAARLARSVCEGARPHRLDAVPEGVELGARLRLRGGQPLIGALIEPVHLADDIEILPITPDDLAARGSPALGR